MNTYQHLDQKRAQCALATLPEDKGVLAKTATLAKGFPAQVMLHGLGQALAFLESKGNDEHKALLHAIETWLLKHADHVPWTAQERQADSLIRRLAMASSSTYRLATDEALEFLAWYRRVATAGAGGEDKLPKED